MRRGGYSTPSQIVLGEGRGESTGRKKSFKIKNRNHVSIWSDKQLKKIIQSQFIIIIPNHQILKSSSHLPHQSTHNTGGPFTRALDARLH